MTVPGGQGFDGVERRGLMFVLSSPSGAGKTTLSRLLIERMPGLTLSVSATTRPMRPGEIEGSDYLFVEKARFEAMVKGDELLEWATVFDNRYGTPRAPVERALSAGTDVLFDIDWQGTQQLREKARADVVSVFILPPSAADLEKRTNGEIAARLFISPKTASVHVSNILAKLSMTSRAEIAAYSVRSGLADA